MQNLKRLKNGLLKIELKYTESRDWSPVENNVTYLFILYPCIYVGIMAVGFCMFVFVSFLFLPTWYRFESLSSWQKQKRNKNKQTKSNSHYTNINTWIQNKQIYNIVLYRTVTINTTITRSWFLFVWFCFVCSSSFILWVCVFYTHVPKWIKGANVEE